MNKPKGMEHHTKDFATLKVKHWIINEIQDCFPNLTDKMKRNPDNATNIYTAFTQIYILKIKNRLTQENKIKIMKEYKVI